MCENSSAESKVMEYYAELIGGPHDGMVIQFNSPIKEIQIAPNNCMWDVIPGMPVQDQKYDYYVVYRSDGDRFFYRHEGRR
jgi:hypothetical protein